MNLFQLIKTEFKAILTNSPIVMTLFGGVLFYSFLYPQPYIKQAPREQMVVVCDLDKTPLSREFVRRVDATPQVKIVKEVYSINNIKKTIQKKEAFGYLLIPKNFSKDLRLQKSPTLVYGGNATYFLVYGSIAEGIANASSSISQEVLRFRKNVSKKPPIILDNKPLFNRTIGYINYILPAVFILILHQVILIGAGIQGANQHEQKNGYWLNVSPLKLITARLFAYLVIGLIISIYYLGYCLELYGVPRLASIKDLMLLTVPFIISATTLGIFIGEIMPRRELVMFFVLVSSTPLVFAAGFIWPTSLIPSWINILVQWFPATPSMMAFLKLNQMGADFSQITNEWLHVVYLSIFYILISWIILRFKHRSAKS